MLVFYDFEVFKYDWLVVLINPVEDEKTVIVNDSKQLESFYNKHKNDIWIGFNSRGYDQHILKGILSGFNPYKISEWIITKDRNGYQFNSAMNKIKLLNYDVSKGKTDYGLKTLEAFMGNNIKETSVPFNIDRKLTSEEIDETIKYCTHDVEQTIEVFLERKDDFDIQLGMINEFGLSIDNIGKTVPQLLSIILGAERVNDRKDDYNIRVPDTLVLNKYKPVAEWFLNSYEGCIAELDKEYETAKEIVKACVGSKKMLKDMKKLVEYYEMDYDNTFAKFFYNRSLIYDVAGVEHTFAWGGVHAAIPKYNYVCKSDELLIMADVTSLYPSLMIQYDLQSRSIKDKSIFNKIYNTNVEMKRSGDSRRPIYKLACNMTYGSMGDNYNNLYDKLHQNLVCVFGQLLLLDLIEKLEPHCKLIQSNTDGILILIKRKDFDLIDDIVYEWEQRTRLGMEFTFAKRVFQKDVNNYIMVTTEGKAKSKGAYVKKLSRLDNDLPIVNKAMVDYMVNDIPIEETINNCSELIMFQKIVKLSDKFDYVEHNNIKYDWKSYRVFASKNTLDGTIYKCKNDGKKDKFANTPERCFILNDDINKTEIPAKLDRNYYINLTKERLNQFGVL
jgi:DNA polymerase